MEFVIYNKEQAISTHAPLAGRDTISTKKHTEDLYFNPRAPCGARQIKEEEIFLIIDISTHAPLAGRDSL